MLRRSGSPNRGVGTMLQARRLSLGLALGLVVTTTTLGLSASAGATPQADLANATAQAKRLEAQISANSDKADALDEQFLQAQSAVADANKKIATAEHNISATEAHSAQLHTRLGDRAALLYMGVGNNDPLGINATSVQDLGSRAKYTEAAAAQDSSMLDELKVVDETLHAQRSDLVKARDDANKKEKAADSARKQVQAINAKMQQLLASTNSNIRSLAAKIEQEQLAAQAAAARARMAQLAAQQAAARQVAAAATVGTNGGGTNDGGGGGGGGSGGGAIATSAADVGVSPGSIPAPSGGAAAAVAYARAQVGKPYIYAGTGPAGFDCSGLTMMAWAQGGVSMAHGSQSQYLSFPHVPISALQPGDLVFFGDSGPSNHHVGIFVGGGTMIEAPHTGAFVRYASIYRSDLIPLGSRP